MGTGTCNSSGCVSRTVDVDVDDTYLLDTTDAFVFLHMIAQGLTSGEK